MAKRARRFTVWTCMVLATAGAVCWLLGRRIHGRNHVMPLPSIISPTFLHSTHPVPAPCSDKDSPTVLPVLNAAASASRDAQTGYILAYSMREQQTKASDNLFALQCWAGTLHTHLSVVEPFMADSRLYFPSELRPGLLRLRDTFDLAIWQRFAAKHGHASLASWERFVRSAPRNLVVARFRYGTHPMTFQRKQALSSHLTVDNSWKAGCASSEDFNKTVALLTREHDFKVMREVCFNFEDGSQPTSSQFNRHLFGGNYPGNISVILEEWRGFTLRENGQRVLIYDSQCNGISNETFAWPSSRLLSEAQTYVAQFLGNKPYIAIMLRLEKINKKSASRGSGDFISACLNRTLSMWHSALKSTSIKQTLLAMDYGKYGTTTFTRGQDDNFKHYYEYIHKAVYPGSSLEQWENSFESVTSIRDAGYIAALQKAIVGKASCIVLSGGGSFQRQALAYYQKINHSRKKQCVYVVKKCSQHPPIISRM